VEPDIPGLDEQAPGGGVDAEPRHSGSAPSARSEMPDRALQHRIAEAVVADLLRRVASGLQARMEGPADA